MSIDLIAATPKTLLVEAARILMERNIECLPVVANGSLVGTPTEADFVTLVARKSG